MRTLFLALFFGFVFVAAPVHAQAQHSDEVAEATVVKVIESSQIIEPDGQAHPYQRLEVIGTSGSVKGKRMMIENGAMSQIGVVEYKAGDNIVLSITPNVEGKSVITITDYVRRTPLYILAAIFVVLTILIGGKRGASSIIGMGVTFALLFLFVLPQLSQGANPYLIVGITTLFVVPVTFFLSHGFNRKTLSAIAGTFIALFLAGVLSHIFIEAAHLTGFASEEAGFLEVTSEGALDIRGLLFAGIIIALLGILEDITVSQAAIVFQLKQANKSFDMFQLFRRAMDVGKDHIASMANTLILVYAGASLPLLLLFIDSPLSFSSILNNEVIAEEIVRTLVASIALILAVPITTIITAAVAGHFSSGVKPK